MTMGPAPMIRMVEMSVRLGGKSRKADWAQKKGAPAARPLVQRSGRPSARVSLDQIPQLRKAFGRRINRHLRPKQPAFALRATARQPSSLMACLAEAAEQRRLEARP